jgi:DNA polymerase-3 subunit delta
MIFLIFGQDNFRSLEQLKILKEDFRKKEQGEIITIEAENFIFSEFKNHLNNLNLFGCPKLIILKNFISERSVELSETTIKEIINLLEKKSSNDVVVFYEHCAVKGVFLNQIKKLTPYYPEFTAPTPLQLKEWIIQELKKQNLKINGEGLQCLVHSTQDFWQAKNELAKLSAYSNQLSLVDLNSLVQPVTRDTIFQLTDAIAQKNSKRAIELLKGQLINGAEPVYLLFMIARQIKILLKVKTAADFNVQPSEMPAQLNEHPFVIQQCLKQIRFFSLKELIYIHDLILSCDKKIKSSKIHPFTLLAKLIYDIGTRTAGTIPGKNG